MQPFSFLAFSADLAEFDARLFAVAKSVNVLFEITVT